MLRAPVVARRLRVGALLLMGVLPCGAQPAPAPDARLPAFVAPGEAQLRPAAAWVRASPSPEAPRVGLVQRGGRVRVEGCVPDCAAPRAWALLAGGGALRLSLLMPPDAAPQEGPQGHLHATVRGAGAPVCATPERGARVVEGLDAGHTVAFLPGTVGPGGGWLARAQGGYVRAADLRPARPSDFAGEASPALPLAFAWREARLTPLEGGAASLVPRFWRERALGTQGREVLTPAGRLPRASVRLAWARPRPSAVPPGARWVHVDLTEQVLTAYEGDTPVYATLVSSGTSERPTRAGLHRVWLKSRHDLMHGEDYLVEEVPHILYFHRGQGLHEAFWHQRFGQRVSHGCVNLSPGDARWLFEWAPPELPPGWHTVMPADGRATLWVAVERAPAGDFPPAASARR